MALEIYLDHMNEKFHLDGAWNSVSRQISSTKESMPGRNDRFALKHFLISKKASCAF